MLDIEELSRTDELFDGHYRLLRPLSTEGGSADVWLALDTNTIDNYSLYTEDTSAIDESTGLLVAIKIYRPKNALDIEGEQRFRDEYKIVHECRHANLLQPTNFSIFKGVPYLVLPYCEAGSSEQFIGQELSTETIWKFILEVASGLNRLHSNQPQIIHQDIKPANILIDSNGNFTITDFGISAKRTGQHESYYDDENSGTLAYMAPERFQDNAVPSSYSDIWAFGATLCEIFTGNVPFGEEGGKAQAEGSVSMPALKELPLSVRGIIHACLQIDPKKRPTALQIVEAAQKKHYFATPKKSGLPVIFTIAAILIIGCGIGFFITQKKPKVVVEPAVEEVVKVNENSYDKAVVLLSEITTADEGLQILDSLVLENDFQATFLMSRLYFEPINDRDKVFYNPNWNNLRSNAGINPDNKKAHRLLFKAFLLNENDYVTLYELGCDYMAPNGQRGNEKNLNYAKWCFLHADTSAKASHNANAANYLDKIKELADRINNHEIQNDTVIQPIKPQQ